MRIKKPPLGCRGRCHCLSRSQPAVSPWAEAGSSDERVNESRAAPARDGLRCRVRVCGPFCEVKTSVVRVLSLVLSTAAAAVGESCVCVSPLCIRIGLSFKVPTKGWILGLLNNRCILLLRRLSEKQPRNAGASFLSLGKRQKGDRWKRLPCYGMWTFSGSG